MLKYVLNTMLDISDTGLILDIVYYSVILISLSVCAVLYHNRLIVLGYGKKKTLTLSEENKQLLQETAKSIKSKKLQKSLRQIVKSSERNTKGIP